MHTVKYILFHDKRWNQTDQKGKWNTKKKCCVYMRCMWFAMPKMNSKIVCKWWALGQITKICQEFQHDFFCYFHRTKQIIIGIFVLDRWKTVAWSRIDVCRRWCARISLFLLILFSALLLLHRVNIYKNNQFFRFFSSFFLFFFFRLRNVLNSSWTCARHTYTGNLMLIVRQKNNQENWWGTRFHIIYLSVAIGWLIIIN